MAFPFAEPADPARYYAQGLAIGERIKENAAAQERNKLLDTFNHSMARIALGMKVEDQAFQRQNTLEDNRRQQQALGASLINAANAAQPKPQWRNVNGKWVQVTADNPLSGVLNEGIRMAGGGTPNTVARTEADPFTIFPNRPFPQEEPANVGGMLPGGPTTDVAQPAVVEGAPLSPELQSPADAVTSPPVSSPPLMLTPPEPVSAPPIPSIFAPVTPGPIAPVTPAQADTAPPEAPPPATTAPLVIGGITIPPGTDEGTVQNITSVQSSLSKAQAAFDAALAKQAALNAELEKEAIDISNMGGTPPSLLDDINRRKLAPVEGEVTRANEALKNEREKLESIVRENNKALAADRENTLRAQQAASIVSGTLEVQGIPGTHPAIRGWEREFEPLTKSQQGKFLQDLQEKIKTVGETERILNGPLFDPVKNVEPQFDGPLRIEGDPLKAKEAMTKVLQTKAEMEATYAAANPPPVMRDGKPMKPTPDNAAIARYDRAKGRYESALTDLQTKVTVLPKPVPETSDLMPAGSGVLLRPAEVAAAPVASTPATPPALLSGMTPKPASTTPAPKTNAEWWTEQKNIVAAGQGSDRTGRVRPMSEYSTEIIEAVADGKDVYEKQGGGRTLDRSEAVVYRPGEATSRGAADSIYGPKGGIQRVGKAEDLLAAELGFNAEEELESPLEAGPFTRGKFVKKTRAEIVREAAKDELERRGVRRNGQPVNTSQPTPSASDELKKAQEELRSLRNK